ncbi:MAG TPA: hypothetical protein DDW52_07660, partial [Planctomycetaceae bacterium]|nr:hypothetical protein [Planctomycetaceae bacterium]
KDGESASSPPRITAIDYQIRLRRSSLDPMRRMVEFQVDLRVELPREDSIVKLPLRSDQVELQSATVDGIGVALGGRVEQTPTEIVFRPRVSGLVAVQMKFREFEAPRTAGKGAVFISVAPLPIATLRVVADSQQDFEINSIGPIQRSMASTLARIGNVSAIDITWVESSRQPVGIPAQDSARMHTWLHAGPQRLVAAAKLTIPAPPANREVEVVIDSGWTPVGNNWGDGKVIASELIAPVGIQKSYQVRLDPSKSENITLQVLLLPRNLERTRSLAVPFLASDLAVNARRTLSWSSTVGAQWKPEGLGSSWQPTDETATEDWGALRLFEGDVANFQSLSEGQSPTVRRILAAAPQPAAVEELNSLHLGDGFARLDYRLKFPESSTSEQIIHSPPNTRIREVAFDGVATSEFLVGTDDIGDKLILRPTNAYSEISVSSTLTTQLDTFANIPRFSVSNSKSKSSILQIFRGAGLIAELESESPLFQTPPNFSDLQLLQDLEVPLAEVKLPIGEHTGGEADEHSIGQFRLSRRANTDSASLLFQLQQSQAGWICTLHCVWTDLSSALDVACFEIPAAVRDTLQFGNLPRRFVPSGSEDTLTLCLIPPAPSSGRSQVSFSFPVASSTSSQSISIPNISLLTGRTKERLLTLPKELTASGQQEDVSATWTQVGASVNNPASWISAALLPSTSLDQVSVFRMLNPQTQVSWERSSTVQPATILHREFVLSEASESEARGSYQFWVEPAGQTEIVLELPAGCDILSATCGGRIVGWNKNTSDSGLDRNGASVNLQLSPNYLPVHFELLLAWQVDPADPTLRMPKIASPAEPPELLVSSALDSVGFDPKDILEQWDAAKRARKWAEVVNDSFGSLVSLEPAEVETWMQAWQPSQLRIPLDSTIVLNSTSGPDPGTLPRVSTADFWAEACSNFELPLEAFELTPGQAATRLSNNAVSYRISSEEVHLVVPARTNPIINRAFAAGLMLCVLGAVLLVRRQIGAQFISYQALNPWSYWLVLAIILGVVSPVLWPTIVVGVLSFYSGVTQLIDAARRRRSLNGQRLA